jgi:cell division protein FtsN
MAKDYASRARATKPHKPRWPWLFGLILSITAMLALALAGYFVLHHSQHAKLAQQPSSPKKIAVRKAPPLSDKNTNQLTFYQLLRKHPSPSKIAPPPQATLCQNTCYYLQVAAVRDKAAAERLLRHYQSRQFNGHLSAENAQNPWYKVMLGPFYNQTQLKLAKESFQAQNIHPLVFKQTSKPQ